MSVKSVTMIEGTLGLYSIALRRACSTLGDGFPMDVKSLSGCQSAELYDKMKAQQEKADQR